MLNIALNLSLSSTFVGVHQSRFLQAAISPTLPTVQDIALSPMLKERSLGEYQPKIVSHRFVDMVERVDIVERADRFGRATESLLMLADQGEHQADYMVKTRRKELGIPRSSLSAKLNIDEGWLIVLENGMMPIEDIDAQVVEWIVEDSCQAANIALGYSLGLIMSSMVVARQDSQLPHTAISATLPAMQAIGLKTMSKKVSWEEYPPKINSHRFVGAVEETDGLKRAVKSFLDISTGQDEHQAGARTLGYVVKTRRKELGIPRSSLSAKLNIDEGWLIVLENGMMPIEDIDAQVVEKIAEELRLDHLALRILAQLSDTDSNFISEKEKEVTRCVDVDTQPSIYQPTE